MPNDQGVLVEAEREASFFACEDLFWWAGEDGSDVFEAAVIEAAVKRFGAESQRKALESLSIDFLADIARVEPSG